MNAAEVEAIEKQFKIKLPAWYLELLESVPDSEDRVEIDHSASDLRLNNEEIRNAGAWGFKWQPTLWAIGGDGAGGIYFIDTKLIEPMVHYIDHEDPPADMNDSERLHSRTVPELLDDFEDQDRQLKIDAEEIRAKVAARKWWQFWIPKRVPAWATNHSPERTS